MEEQVLGTGSRLTPLCALAKKYGTDKYPWYTPFYDALLFHRREAIVYMLEVGIGTPNTMPHMKGYVAGASLQMWRDYFPNAIIYGLDINRVAVDSVADTRIRTIECDQRSEESLKTILPGLSVFNLIVDDGSHDIEDQGRTYSYLHRLLAPGGLYIIEDANVDIVGLPVASQVVECRAPGYPLENVQVGRCVVIQSS